MNRLLLIANVPSLRIPPPLAEVLLMTAELVSVKTAPLAISTGTAGMTLSLSARFPSTRKVEPRTGCS